MSSFAVFNNDAVMADPGLHQITRFNQLTGKPYVHPGSGSTAAFIKMPKEQKLGALFIVPTWVVRDDCECFL